MALADGLRVSGIGPDLRPVSRVSGAPQRLRAASAQSYYGTVISGAGFILTADEAEELVLAEPGASEVVRSYLTGGDLLTTADSCASRFVIDFQDWPLERAAAVAPLALARVERLVKPERDRVARQSYRERWWQFAERSANLYRAIANLERALVVPQTGKFLPIVFAQTKQIFAQSVMVFPFESPAAAAVLNSSLHSAWVSKTSGTLDTRATYRPTDSYETFVWPARWHHLELVGQRLLNTWSEAASREGGMTNVLNAFHSEVDGVPEALITAQQDVDEATLEAYGWSDLSATRDFVEDGRAGVRRLPTKSVRIEMLDRLLELNHQRYAEEVSKGLHDKGSKKAPRKEVGVPVNAPMLFGEEA